MRKNLFLLLGGAIFGLALLFVAPHSAAAANSADLKILQDGSYVDGPIQVDGITFNPVGTTPYHMQFDWNATVAAAAALGQCKGSITYNSWTGHVVSTPWYAVKTYNFNSPDGKVHQNDSFDINLPANGSSAYLGQGYRIDYTITCRANGKAPVSDTVSVVYTAQLSHPKIDTLALNTRPGDVDDAVKIPNTGAYSSTFTMSWQVREATSCVPYIAESSPSELTLAGWGWEYPQITGDPTVQTSATFAIKVPLGQLPYGTAAIVNYALTCYNLQGRSSTRYIAVHVSRLDSSASAGCGTQVTDVAFVLDSSSSMDELLPDRQSKRQASNRAISDFQALMRSHSLPVRYSFMSFSGGADFATMKFDGVTLNSPYGVYQAPDKAGGPSTNPNSGTCLACAIKALESSYAQQYRSAYAPVNPKIMVLLTDGEVTVAWDGVRFPQYPGDPGYGIPQNGVVPNGPISVALAEAQVLQFANNLASKYPSAQFFTVGLGRSSQLDEPLLKSIARITHPANDDYSLVTEDYGMLSTFYREKLPEAVQTGTPVQMSGTVFEDVNGNGIRDVGEPVINGTSPPRIITISTPFNAANPPSTVPVGVNGDYTITKACPDEYRLSQSLPPGWVQTKPPAVPGYYQEYVTENIVRDFGSSKPTAPVIRGVVYADANNNGVKDAGENGISGQIIALEKSDGTPTGVQTMTAPDGTYNLVFPGSITWTDSYILQQSTPPVGYSYGTPPTGAYAATVYPFGVSTRDFADITVPAGSSVAGTVFNDANSNGSQDAGELGVSGATVTLLDAANNVVTSAVTDSLGGYVLQISGRAAGQKYTVKATAPATYSFTIPVDGQYQNELLDPGTNLTRNFGMRVPPTDGYGQFCS